MPRPLLQQPEAIRRHRIECKALFHTAKFAAEGARNASNDEMRNFWRQRAVSRLRAALKIQARIPTDARERFPYLAVGW